MPQCNRALWRACWKRLLDATPLRRIIRNLRIVPDADDPDHVPVKPVEEAVSADEDLAETELWELRDRPSRIRETDEVPEYVQGAVAECPRGRRPLSLDVLDSGKKLGAPAG